MHLKAVLVVVVDTVGIAIVLHEREARGEDGIQATLMELVCPHPGKSTL